MSRDIISELITLLGNALLRQILIKIHAAFWIAILADETEDVTHYEQLSMSIRWVNEFYEINEDFIGLVHVPSTTSSTITTVIKDVLIRCDLPITHAVSRSKVRWSCQYDGPFEWDGKEDKG